MNESTASRAPAGGEHRGDVPGGRYEPPRYEVISLDCEISSYAPDEDDTPLF